MRDRLNINEAYFILGLTSGATETQIKQAYRRLVKIWHPDQFSAAQQKQEAEEKLKKINQAYELLKSHQPPDAVEPTPVNQSWQKQKTNIYTTNISAETFYQRGVDNASLGRYQQALNDFSQAIRLNPRHIEAYRYRGWICSLLGFENRADWDLYKAAELEWESGKTNIPPIPPQPKQRSPYKGSKRQGFLVGICQSIKRWLRLK